MEKRIIGLAILGALVIGIAAVNGGRIGPGPYAPADPADFQDCLNNDSHTKKLREMEYTGEKSKGSAEDFCRQYDEMMATKREQERLRKEYRAKNP
jgi:hypothetical protein